VVLFVNLFYFKVIVDTRGFKLHKNSQVLKKKPRGGELTVEEKTENRRISRARVLVESIIAKFKVFKILANKYCNRRKRYDLRASLICGIINHEKRS
jgi:hypothetical protein